MARNGGSFCASERRPPLALPKSPRAEQGAVLSTDPPSGPQLGGPPAKPTQPSPSVLSTAPPRRRPPTAGRAAAVRTPAVLSTDPKAAATAAPLGAAPLPAGAVAAAAAAMPTPQSQRASLLATAGQEWPRLCLGPRPEGASGCKVMPGPKQGGEYRPGELLSMSASVAAAPRTGPSAPPAGPPGRWVLEPKGVEQGGDRRGLFARQNSCCSSIAASELPAGMMLTIFSSAPPSAPGSSTAGRSTPATAPAAQGGACLSGIAAPPGLATASPSERLEDAAIQSLQAAMGKLELGTSELPSVGSVGHALGRCKPCAFLYKDECQAAVDCHFCHICEDGEKKRRKREHRAAKRAVVVAGMATQALLQPGDHYAPV